MNFKEYANRVKELQNNDIYPHELLLVEYLQSNSKWFSDEFDLEFSDDDLNNALDISANYYRKSDSISFDMLAMIGLSLAKWNFISEELQQQLLKEANTEFEMLDSFISDQVIEWYAIPNEEPVR